jgi:arylsulfatase A-like enzyme
VQALQREGMTFDRYFVTNSLCCPSRASIFSGQYPHSSGVLTNMPPAGGVSAFRRHDTFAVSLEASGYMTALMGKYLNGYRPLAGRVPPGWTEWAVGGEAYANYDYALLTRKKGRTALARYGSSAGDYLTDVISRRGQGFIRRAAKAKRPFLLELSTYTPHAPFTPAPRDAATFPGLTAPRSTLYDAPQLVGAPRWLTQGPLSAEQMADLDSDFRLRVQSVQAIDKLIGDVRAQLRRLGVAGNTYIVFSSDNGYHMGERRLHQGKQTAFDHDIRVPLIVAGPGVPAGATVSQPAANVDLRPTFEELADAFTGPQVEGRSLVPFLRGRAPAWRDAVLVEHRGSNSRYGDPDAQFPGQGKPPSYSALRMPGALYVEYVSPRQPPEFYDLAADPDARSNVFSSLGSGEQARLADRLARLRNCSGGVSCQAADR